MARHKLVTVREDKYRKDVRIQMAEFVSNCYLKGKNATLQDIQDVFQDAPFSLSEGTVINYLAELVDKRKLSTWKEKGRRYGYCRRRRNDGLRFRTLSCPGR